MDEKNKQLLDQILKYAAERKIQIPADIVLKLSTIYAEDLYSELAQGQTPSETEGKILMGTLRKLVEQIVLEEIPEFGLMNPGLVPAPGRSGLMLMSTGWKPYLIPSAPSGGGGGGTGISDAPGDSQSYVRYNRTWIVMPPGVTQHSLLTGLDYASAGHTGFQSTLTFPLSPTLGGTGIANLAASTLTLGAATSITGGGTLALGGFTGTVPATATFAMGAGTLTSATINDVTGAAHTHAITESPLLVGDGSAAYQVLTTGEPPPGYTPQWSGYYLQGSAGGTTNFAVTNTKTLRFIATDDRNITFPITGTAAIGAGTLTSATTNDVTVNAHTHAITASTALVAAGTAQYQVLTTGANPYAAAWSDFYLKGTTGGTTNFAVTNTKTLTLTAADDYNLTIPATGTAALLATANVFTANQTISYSNLLFNLVVAPTNTTAVLAGIPGNIDNGNHFYRTTFVTASGETESCPSENGITVVDKTVNGQATVSIQVSANPNVTGRKVYRTKANLGPTSVYYLCVTINNNVDVTAPDNVADASLGAILSGLNTTGGNVLFNTSNYMLSSNTLNTVFGYLSGGANTGVRNLIIGPWAGYSITRGTDDMYIGWKAGYGTTSGSYNIGIGTWALKSVTTTGSNIAIGSYAGYSTTGDSNIFIGPYAGYWETGTYYFYLHNTLGGGSIAAQRASHMLFGQFSSTTANQTLTTNGAFGVNTIPTALLHAVSLSTAAGIKTLQILTALGSGANGDGGAIAYNGKTSTTAATAMGLDQWLWVNATHASRTARRVFNVYDTAIREVIRIEASGTAAMIGFLGAAAVVRPLATADLGVALSDLGLRVAGTAYPITTSGAVSFTGGVTTSGGRVEGVTTYTDTCNILTTDECVIFNKATAFTATMPAAIVGQRFYFKNIGVGNVTLSFPGTDTVDEVDDDLIMTQYDSYTLICRLANKWVKV